MNPYYIPQTAPETPPPDFTVAKIIGSADLAGAYTRGFSSMVQANAERNRTELGMREMALNQQKQDQGYELAKVDQAQKFDFQQQNYNLARTAQEQHREDYIQKQSILQERFQRANEEKAAKLDAAKAFEQSNHNVIMNYHDAKMKSGVEDGERWTNDPAGVAQAYYKLQEGFGSSLDVTGVPADLDAIKSKVEQLPKIKLRPAVVKDGTLTLKDEYSEFTPLQVVKGLKSDDPVEREMFRKSLADKGQFTPAVDDIKRTTRTGKGLLGNYGPIMWGEGKPTEEIIPGKPESFTEPWLREGMKINVKEHVQNQVPWDAPRSKTDRTYQQQETSPTTVREMRPEATAAEIRSAQADTLYAQAQRMANVPGSNKDGIRKFLADNKLDPNRIK